MQSKGLIKFLAIVIALACLFQLSFTAATWYQEGKAEKYAGDAVEAFKLSPAYASVSDNDKAYYLDSLRDEKNRYYIDSITSEKVFLGYTYKQVKEKEISLGLDLKGGMNVMLQVQLRDLIVALSGGNDDPALVQALDLADRNQVTNPRTDYITLFAEAWNQVAPGKNLSLVFGTYEMRDKIKPETSNDEVISVIRTEAESAIANSFNVLRNRIDRFGVTQPNIQKLGNSGRILVELPGVKEPERVRKLLQGTASLEFWPTYENKEIYSYLIEANSVIREMNAIDSEEAEKENSGSESLLSKVTAVDSLSGEDMQFAKNNPLFAVLSPNVYGGQVAPGPMVGLAHYKDTAKINAMLAMPQVQMLFPSDLRLMWTVKPSSFDKSGVMYELVAIKANTRDGKAPLDGGAVEDARTDFRSQGGSPEVSMTMNAEGARVWARMTADNIGRSIAIVLDGMVYSFPTVRSEIANGISSISGGFTIEEATDLTNVLKSGKLPAPAVIVQEQVVGPTLGSDSIKSGLVSFIIAFVLVLAYMIFFYSQAGVVASLALICNVLFLFGTLVSFGAVLTLPGIAGLVLTLGMAVDANVIIYERVKEEIAAGKALRAAIKDGYNNAYSAIIDGNLTTIITGIVLFVFGSGPIQGFATTLIIGILSSLATSIFITRLIFEGRLSAGRNISFDNRLTRNFLKNTKVDFIGIRKYAYMISSVIVIVSLSSIFTKGFTYGVDFTGGRTYVVRFDKEVNIEEVRTALMHEFEGSVEVKQFGGDTQMKITTKYMIEDNSNEADEIVDGKLYNALKGFFAKTDISYGEFTSTLDNPNGIISSDKVGPTIANDIKIDAIVAVVVALFAIFLYIAVRFKNWTWGLGGVMSLTHVTIFVLGFFSLFSGILPFSLDVDQTFIAAVLTIIGYAINDNVVIFDRIREYKTLYPNRDLRTSINLGINSTLSRTINTSGTTLVVLLAIAIFGGDVIRGFSVALISGIVVGTYSSIFVGTPIMYDLNMRKVRKETAEKQK